MTFVFNGPMSQSTYFLPQNVSKIRKAESMHSYQGRISDKGHPGLELQQRKPGGAAGLHRQQALAEDSQGWEWGTGLQELAGKPYARTTSLTDTISVLMFHMKM